jgi:Cu+-exporting ATPase
VYAAFAQNVQAASPGAKSQAKGEHTCPMHPEVKQNGPGKCPKCGMSLTAKSGDGHAH